MGKGRRTNITEVSKQYGCLGRTLKSRHACVRCGSLMERVDVDDTKTLLIPGRQCQSGHGSEVGGSLLPLMKIVGSQRGKVRL